MSAAPPTSTTFVSRGRLTGVMRHRPDASLEDRSPQAGAADLDTQAWEAVYYRARLVLGESLSPPAYLQARGQ